MAEDMLWSGGHVTESRRIVVTGSRFAAFISLPRRALFEAMNDRAAVGDPMPVKQTLHRQQLVDGAAVHEHNQKSSERDSGMREPAAIRCHFEK
jgi:hypothetical protein